MSEKADNEQSGAAGAKTASGLTVFLMEELSNARLACFQLKRYIDQAMGMVDKSNQRDHFFEVAGQIIHGVPEQLQKLEKSLDASSLAASRLDYEELKQELRPDKLNDLENMLEDVRIRYLSRRSTEDAMTITPKVASDRLMKIADDAELLDDPKTIVAGLTHLIKDLESNQKTASKINSPKMLRVIAQSLTSSKRVNREEVLAALRQILATTLVSASTPAQETISSIVQASDKESGLFNFPPDADDVRKPIEYLKDAQRSLASIQAWADKYYHQVDKFPMVGDHDSSMKSKRDALLVCRTLESQAKMAIMNLEHIEKHCQDLSEDIIGAFHSPMAEQESHVPMGVLSASSKTSVDTSKQEWEHALKMDEDLLKKVQHDLAKLHKGEDVPNLTLENAKKMEESLKQVIENKKKLLSKLSSESKLSLYNETALQQMLATMPFDASSREEVMKGFKEANPDMSEEDLEKAADMWEKNRNVVKDQAKEVQASYNYNRTAAIPGTIDGFLTVLQSKLIQYDKKLEAKQPNIYRLGHLLKAKEQVEHDVSHMKDRDDKEALETLKKSIAHHFIVNSMPPAKAVIKQIDDYLTSKKAPKLASEEAYSYSRLRG